MCNSLSVLLCQRYLVLRGSGLRSCKKLCRLYNDDRCVTVVASTTKNSRFLVNNETNRRKYGSAAIASSSMPGVLSKQQAKDLAVRLTSNERDVLISALQECQSQKVKAEYEGTSFYFNLNYFSSWIFRYNLY